MRFDVISRPCGLVLLMAATTLAPVTAGAAFKCWTNSDGVRECGNAVPPEYAQQRTRTLNEQGITLEVQERAKTRDEVLREQQRKAEEERQRKEAEQRRVEQEAYDRMLLATFTTEQELIASRDRKLAAIEATIEVTHLSIANIRTSMDDYKRRAADLERSGRPVPDDLKADIAKLQQQVDAKMAYIGNKEAEMAALQAKYDGDLARFRQLKGAASNR